MRYNVRQNRQKSPHLDRLEYNTSTQKIREDKIRLMANFSTEILETRRLGGLFVKFLKKRKDLWNCNITYSQILL